MSNRFKFIQQGDEEYIIDYETLQSYEIYSVEDAVKITSLLNELDDKNSQLQWSNKILRESKRSCELGRKEERKRWANLDDSRIKFIRILQRRLKKHGLSPYLLEDSE